MCESDIQVTRAEPVHGFVKTSACYLGPVIQDNRRVQRSLIRPPLSNHTILPPPPLLVFQIKLHNDLYKQSVNTQNKQMVFTSLWFLLRRFRR